MRLPSALQHRCALPGGNILLTPICACVGMAPALSCCLSLDSFSPHRTPCQAEAGWSHQQQPLSMCVHLFPCLGFPPFHILLQLRVSASKGVFFQPHSPSNPSSTPPKILPFCLTFHWVSISYLHPLLWILLNNLVPPRTSHIPPLSMALSSTSCMSPTPGSTECQDLPPAAVKGLRLGSD